MGLWGEDDDDENLKTAVFSSYAGSNSARRRWRCVTRIPLITTTMYATPRCAKCDSPVYAAEQVLGPARKPYHKPCLACTHCNKRLDSYSLLEHDTEPFCKPCHVKAFGTVDLRSANLPVAASPSRASFALPTTPIKVAVTGPAPPLRTPPVRPFATGSPRFVAPATPRCAVCDKPVYHAEMVCSTCRNASYPSNRVSRYAPSIDPTIGRASAAPRVNPRLIQPVSLTMTASPCVPAATPKSMAASI